VSSKEAGIIKSPRQRLGWQPPEPPSFWAVASSATPCFAAMACVLQLLARAGKQERALCLA
jgi:hypothetical protein